MRELRVACKRLLFVVRLIVDKSFIAGFVF
jgi:hypothetical protein